MSSPTLDQVRSIIKERSDLFETNFASGNAAKLVAEYYVPESMGLIVSAPDAPALRDHASIVALFEALVKDFSRARQVPHFIRADGHLAYEVSNSYLTPKTGGAEIEFRYVATWRRCEDTWRVEADFFALGPIV
jgi:hypothetical protein